MGVMRFTHAQIQRKRFDIARIVCGRCRVVYERCLFVDVRIHVVE